MRCISLQQIAEHNNEFTTTPTDNGTISLPSVVQRVSSPGPKVQKNKKEDYTMVRLLGKGAFATVVLVQKNSNKKLYAMKVVKKELLSRVSNSLTHIGK